MNQNSLIAGYLFFFFIEALIFWMAGKYFRRDGGGASILFLIITFFIAIFGGMYGYLFFFEKICPYLHCEFIGEKAWNHIYFSVGSIPFLWGLIVMSMRKKK